ncbi:MAG: putative porin [bacterium]|nr:putative porin [bacterium]
MLKKLSIMLAAALLLGLAWTTVAYAAFDDVPADHWAYDAVQYLAGEGLVIGYPDGTYGGDRLLTRYEFAMVISRLYDDILAQIDAGGANPEVDVEAVLDKLIEEFQPEIDELRELAKLDSDRLGVLEGNVSGFDSRINEVEKLVADMDTRFHPFGDLYLRIYGMYPETGLHATQPQFQLRVGFVSKVTDELTFGARLVSGERNPRQSDYDIMDDNFGFDGIHIDRAYLMWKPQCYSNLTVWGGKFAPPYITTPLLYDPDVQVEGLAESYSWDNFNFTLAELIPAQQGLNIVAQAGLNNFLLDNSRFALTYHYFSPSSWAYIKADMEGGALPSTWLFDRLDSPDDYRAIEAYWDWKSHISSVPFMIQLNYLRNLEETAAGLPDEAGLQQAAWGALTFHDLAISDCGDWNVWMEFGRAQPNSTLTWQSEAWRKASDNEFWLGGLKYRMIRNTDLTLIYLNSQTLVGSAPDFNTFLAIISTSF